YQGGSFTPINDPNAVFGTAVQGISGNLITGFYYDAMFQAHGFSYDGTTYTNFDVPASTATYGQGVSGNEIVGTYADATQLEHGYLYDGSSFTTIDDPNGIGGT